MAVVRPLVKGLLTLLVIAIPALLLLAFVPGLPPDIDFKPFRIQPPTEEVMKLLDSNNILDEAELYYEGPYIGMESVVELDDDSVVTSDQSGTVFRVTGKQTATNITSLKFPCEYSPYGGGGEEGIANCGWPLGMRLIDSENTLVFMDYFGGMVKLDLKTGLYETLVPKNAKINGKIGCTPEDLDVAKDGTIYWSVIGQTSFIKAMKIKDGSTNEDFFVEMLGQPSGRLIKYDPVKKTNEVLLDDLHFSNGVCLSENGDFVIVAEFGSASIRRYYLHGKKKGNNDIFISGLPGYPDNIRSNGRGGFYVAIYLPWNEYSMNTYAYSSRPLLRKIILRLRHILLITLEHIRSILPSDSVYLNDMQQYIRELRPILRIHQRPKVAIIAELSNSGELIAVYNGKSGKIPNLSQITVGKKYAYLASPFDNKLWRINKKNLKV